MPVMIGVINLRCIPINSFASSMSDDYFIWKDVPLIYLNDVDGLILLILS